MPRLKGVKFWTFPYPEKMREEERLMNLSELKIGDLVAKIPIIQGGIVVRWIVG